jgi:hypothetical protein
MSRNESTPHFTERTFTISVSSDGTKTTAKVLVDGYFGGKAVVAEGKARRRKGESRNPELGYALAVSRAIEELSKKETANTAKAVKEAFGE